MFKKLIFTLVLCCTLSAVSNANWLSMFFSRFVSAGNDINLIKECSIACRKCERAKEKEKKDMCDYARAVCNARDTDCPAAHNVEL